MKHNMFRGRTKLYTQIKGDLWMIEGNIAEETIQNSEVLKNVVVVTVDNLKGS